MSFLTPDREGKKMTVRINKDGTLKSSITGIKGDACSLEVAALGALGTVIRDEATDEFWEGQGGDNEPVTVQA